MTRKALHRYGAPLLYVLVFLLALATRVYHLAARPLWIDEAFSVWMARHSWQQIWMWTVRIDQHPPGYYGLLHLWGNVWGWSEAGVRTLSLLAGLLTLLPVMHMASILAGKRAALWASLLLALSPFHVAYAQEARMYTWVTFAIALALWGAIRMVNSVRDRWGGMALGLGTAMSLWLHNMAVLFPLALVGWGYVWYRKKEERALARPFRRTLLWSGGAWLLWMPFFVRQARGVMHRFWIPYPTWRTLFDTFHTFHWGVAAPRELVFWAGDVMWVGVAFVGGWYLWRKGEQARASLLATVLLLPIGMALVVSLLRPIFLPRLFLWATVPYLLLAAVGLSALSRQRRVSSLLLAGGMMALLVSAWAHYDADYTKEDWPGAVGYVASRARSGDLVLFNATWAQLPFDYYAQRVPLPVEERGIPVDLFARGELEPAMTEADVPHLLNLIRGRARVWLVYSHAWYTDPKGIIPRVLAAQMTQVAERRFVGIRVVLYSRESRVGSR